MATLNWYDDFEDHGYMAPIGVSSPEAPFRAFNGEVYVHGFGTGTDAIGNLRTGELFYEHVNDEQATQRSQACLFDGTYIYSMRVGDGFAELIRIDSSGVSEALVSHAVTGPNEYVSYDYDEINGIIYYAYLGYASGGGTAYFRKYTISTSTDVAVGSDANITSIGIPGYNRDGFLYYVFESSITSGFDFTAKIEIATGTVTDLDMLSHATGRFFGGQKGIFYKYLGGVNEQILYSAGSKAWTLPNAGYALIIQNYAYPWWIAIARWTSAYVDLLELATDSSVTLKKTISAPTTGGRSRIVIPNMSSYFQFVGSPLIFNHANGWIHELTTSRAEVL